MNQVLAMQKDEANKVFSRFVERNYLDWLTGKSKEKPVQSHNLIKEKVFPLMNDDKPLFVILIDNLRYDQWKFLQPILEEYFRVEKD